MCQTWDFSADVIRNTVIRYFRKKCFVIYLTVQYADLNKNLHFVEKKRKVTEY